MTYQIQPYHPKNQQQWDHFVLEKSANGNIFHTQSFLNYHPKNQFRDASILIYKAEELICVLAACHTKSGFFSHLGTSCGGPIFHEKYYNAKEVYHTVNLIQNHYHHKLSIRICESHLTKRENDLLLFLFQKTHNFHAELSVQIPLTPNSNSLFPIIKTSKNRRKVQKVLETDIKFEFTIDTNDYKDFHSLLSKNLIKYNTTPTHDMQDFLNLKKILNQNQLLLLAKDSTGNLHGGIWVIEVTPSVWHTQYIVTNYESSFRDIPLTMIELLAKKLYCQQGTMISLGISTEKEGSILNQSLIHFKENFHHQYENRYILTPKENFSFIVLK